MKRNLELKSNIYEGITVINIILILFHILNSKCNYLKKRREVFKGVQDKEKNIFCAIDILLKFSVKLSLLEELKIYIYLDSYSFTTLVYKNKSWLLSLK